MRSSQTFYLFDKLVRRINPNYRLKHHESLHGGSSAEVTLLEVVDQDSKRLKVVHRLYGDIDLRQNPNVGSHEYRVLKLTQLAGLATPRPVYLDVPQYVFGRPSIVVEYISGRIDLNPRNLVDYIKQLSCELAQLHKIKTRNVDLPFLLLIKDSCDDLFLTEHNFSNVSVLEQQLIETLSSSCHLVHNNPSVVLHGDFWPGNTLWQKGRLKAIIDWEDTRWGDPLADLSNARLEIFMLFDADKMSLFTRCYESHNDLDFSHLPWWDLYASLRFINRLDNFVSPERNRASVQSAFSWFIKQAQSRMGQC